MRAPQWVLAGRRVLAAETARLAAWSPAVRWGVGLFETVGCDRGRPLLLDEHCTRLRRGSSTLGMTLPELPDEGAVARLLRRERLSGPAGLRIQALSDTGAVRVISWAHRYRVPRRLRRHGAVLLPVELPAGALPGVKSCSRLPLYWAHRLARLAGADAALLVDTDGALREADHANLFAVVAGAVVTPPAPSRCLPGVMRAWCIGALVRSGVGVHERDLSVADLLGGGGAWLTSSLAGVVPVRRLGSADLPLPRKLLGLLASAGVPAPGLGSSVASGKFVVPRY